MSYSGLINTSPLTFIERALIKDFRRLFIHILSHYGNILYFKKNKTNPTIQLDCYPKVCLLVPKDNALVVALKEMEKNIVDNLR